MNPKKHPDYDSETLSKETMDKMAAAFGAYDDRKGRKQRKMTLNDTAERFGITALKARKILITAGAYSTVLSRTVQEMNDRGMSVMEIGKKLNLGRASVHSYLPYSRIIYNMEQLSTTAERQKRYRERQLAVKALKNAPAEENLWRALYAFQGYPFFTEQEDGIFAGHGEKQRDGGRKYTYHVIKAETGEKSRNNIYDEMENEISEKISGKKEDSVSSERNKYFENSQNHQILQTSGTELVIEPDGERIFSDMIHMAYQIVWKRQGLISAPEELKVSGAEYLFPIFARIGLIQSFSASIS